MVFGNKSSIGCSLTPAMRSDAAAVYEVNSDGLIAAVWFFNAD